jgi:hypothetical protein
MEESIASKSNHKKFVDMMTKKTHFTELEVERLIDLFGKTVVWLPNRPISLEILRSDKAKGLI